MVKKENVFNLEVYATLKHSAAVGEEFDILVFTSPSNVKLFRKNKILPNHRVVAMGEATGKALNRRNSEIIRCRKALTIWGCFRTVLGLAGN